MEKMVIIILGLCAVGFVVWRFYIMLHVGTDCSDAQSCSNKCCADCLKSKRNKEKE